MQNTSVYYRNVVYSEKGIIMSESLAVYRVASGQLSLPGIFERAFQRVSSGAIGRESHVVANFAATVVDSSKITLVQLSQLSDDDKALCLSLMEYCLNNDITEDQRKAVFNAFAPFVDTQAKKRH
ncbi:conserved hypothetical protein [Candidatus Methylobacter favarea]|uniref:Uncharacterized protein n=2 Tax=Candidatus Methylobacter favarea TaxID=2707345 RepID=A0A8S0WAJ2_9GAMM|nr:conserved hypothetical protein [Candidatus Methylobacter favarea]